MITRLLLANTSFELELENPSLELKSIFHMHHNFLQLQFLPVLFAKPEDHVVVTHYPPDEYLLSLEKRGFKLPHFLLLEDVNRIRGDDVFVWGTTMQTQKLFPYLSMPSIDSVLEISSKLFAHRISPLPGSKVLQNRKDFEAFANGSHEKIIKTPQGFSGRGNIPITAKKKISSLTFPVLGEPLKKRLLDFSTHWEIRDGDLQYVGATSLENTLFGTYIGNSAGSIDLSPYLEDQKSFVISKKNEFIKSGYFGPLSIDAMVYEEEGFSLQPIIEVNPRRTMGWLAHTLWGKWGGTILEIKYEKNIAQEGLLPNEIYAEKKISFSKQLTYTIYQ